MLQLESLGEFVKCSPYLVLEPSTASPSSSGEGWVGVIDNFQEF